MGDKSVETLCHIGLLKVNFSPHLYNSTPSPFSMLDFLFLEFAHFLYNIEKGEGVGPQSKPHLKWDNWNVAISTTFSQLSQLLLLLVVDYYILVQSCLRYQCCSKQYQEVKKFCFWFTSVKLIIIFMCTLYFLFVLHKMVIHSATSFVHWTVRWSNHTKSDWPWFRWKSERHKCKQQQYNQ